jgi:DNA-binding NarL/FixJ family response regulator
MGTDMIDVIIADHQEVFRIEMAEVLGGSSDIGIVGKPECPKQLLATLTTVNPHVLILSRSFLRALPKIRRLLKRRPSALLVLTGADDPVAYVRLLGAQGILYRSMEGSAMVDMVRHTARTEPLAHDLSSDALENPPNRPAA